MLNDCAVDGEFVPGLLFGFGLGGRRGGGFGDEGFENGIDDGAVPDLGLRVIVGGRCAQG